MAAFSETPEDIGRLDYCLLQSSAVVLYRRGTVLAEDVDELRRLGYVIDELDAGAWTSSRNLHSAFAAALDFPDWYGANLSALSDCLSDVAVNHDGGRAIVIRNFESFAKRDADLAWNIADIVENASRRHLLFGRWLLLLLQVADGSFELPTVGARGVGWNPKEWLTSNRRD